MDTIEQAPASALPDELPAKDRPGSVAASLVRLLRPHHWTKNLLCLAGVVFSGQYLAGWAVRAAFATVGVFCAAASSIYIVNDLVDRRRDQAHPLKKSRPLPSGAVSVPTAVLLALVLGTGAVAAAVPLGVQTLACTALYILLNLAYSFWLKHQPVIDVLSIALGFVLRMTAGVYAVRDIPTSWITLCTFFLSLYLAFVKRRSEVVGHGSGEAQRRPVLAHYTLEFLDQMVVASGAISILCYALFTTTSGKNLTLLVTVPIVVFGVMHYHRVTLRLPIGEEPERILLKDFKIQACLLLWLASYVAILHFNPRLFR